MLDIHHLNLLQRCMWCFCFCVLGFVFLLVCLFLFVFCFCLFVGWFLFVFCFCFVLFVCFLLLLKHKAFDGMDCSRSGFFKFSILFSHFSEFNIF